MVSEEPTENTDVLNFQKGVNASIVEQRRPPFGEGMETGITSVMLAASTTRWMDRIGPLSNLKEDL